MNAFEVNAGYDPSRNMMIFPAAILQAPFFDAEADLASNYGSIGAVIGHEITHGFDLSGSQFDGYGNLVSWWTEEDFDAFLALNDEVIAQYSAIEFLPGLMVDGELTVGENVADMGGVQHRLRRAADRARRPGALVERRGDGDALVPDPAAAVLHRLLDQLARDRHSGVLRNPDRIE